MTDGLNGSCEYTFGDFTYRASDNTLRRGDEILSVTPKALDLLRVLIANPKKLLTKDELMEMLWPDSYVEESNLAVTIRRLRKALADDAHTPAYIETVARQGYRFVAQVGKTQDKDVGPARNRRTKVRYLIPVAVAACLLIASISLGSLYLRTGRSQAAPILSAPFAAEKLSQSGKVGVAVISPDGKNVVYAVKGAAGDAVWLRETASENNVEIIPSSDQKYYDFALSPDGDTLYFTRGPRTFEDPADVFSVSIFGGIPKKLVSDTRGWISVAPDGKLISFVRCASTDKENCSLWTANATDGSNQTMIASRPRPLRIGAHQISPDGKSVVFAAGQTENAANDFRLVSLDLESGKETDLTTERFFNIRGIEILPDNTGLLFTGSRGSTRQYRVWKLDYADGSVLALSKDSDSYHDISLDDAGSRLIATQTTNDFRLVRASLIDPSHKETIAEQVGRFSFGKNGEVVFQSEATGDAEIWWMDSDGVRQRQLTNVAGDDGAPIFSGDASNIYFCSNRTGDVQVWKMNPDGSEQSRLTKAVGGIPMFAAKGWVYYQHGVDRSLWRVAYDGRIEEPIYKFKPYMGPFVFSPTGDRAAFVDLRTEKPTAVIISIPDGRELASLGLAEGKGRFEIAWLMDETAIAYSLSEVEGGSNTLWIQPLDGSSPHRAASLGGEEIGSLSFVPGEGLFAFVQGGWKHDLVMVSGFQ